MKLVLALALVGALGVTGAAMSASAGDRMVGGGWIENPEFIDNPDIKVRQGMVLQCGIGNPDIRPSSLEVTWGKGNYFHLREMETAVCNPFAPGIDDGGTQTGTGTGICNGQPARAEWTIGDNMTFIVEPFIVIADGADLRIVGNDTNVCFLDTVGARPLIGGNFTFIDNPDI